MDHENASSRTLRSHSRHSRLRMLKLEPRLLFDGAAVVEATAAAAPADSQPHWLDVRTTDQNAAPALATAEKQAEQQITAFLQQPNASDKLFDLFNGGATTPSAEWRTAVDTLLKSMKEGNTPVRVELLSNDAMQGAFGAFAGKGPDGTPVIYLNADWLRAGASSESITRVLLEEFGHSLDSTLNGSTDTPGDEGEAFAEEVQGHTLSDATLQRIASEDDHGTVIIDGISYTVEDANVTFISVYQGTPSALSEEAQMLGNLQPLLGSNFRFTSSDPSDLYFSGNNVTGWLTYTDSNNVQQSIYGVVSRLFKTGSVVEGFYFYAPGADGIIGTGDTGEKAYALVIDPSKFATNGSYGTSSDPVDTALNDYLANYTRPSATADTSSLAGAQSAIEAGYNVTGREATGNVLTNDIHSNSLATLAAGTSNNNLATVSDVTANAAYIANNGLLGNYGRLFIGTDGSYRYVVDNSNAAVSALRQSTDVLYDTYVYRITDDRGNTSTTTLKITIQGSNDAPVAVNDYGNAKESIAASNNYTASDTTGSTSTGNVLANDRDVDAYGETKAILGLEATALAGTVTNGASTTQLSFIGDGTLSNVSTGYYLYIWNGSSYVKAVDSNNNHITVTGKTDLGNSNYDIRLSGNPTAAIVSNKVAFDNKTQATMPNSAKTATVSTATTVGSTTLSNLNITSGTIAVGMTVSGNGINAPTEVSAVTYGANGSITSVTLSNSISSTSSDVLTFSAAGGVTITGQYGTLVLQQTGDYVYTPFANNPNLGAGQTGVDSFRYAMLDASGVKASATLSITVTGSAATDPNAVNDTTSITENTSATQNLSVLTNDTTPSGTNTVISGRATGSVAETAISTGSYQDFTGLYGTLRLYANGTYSYSLDNSNTDVNALNNGQSLNDSFQYRIQNTAGGQDVATITVTINGANDAPVASNDTLSAIEDTATTFTADQLVGNDTDVDGGTLVVQSVTNGTGGTVVLNGDGTVTFTPATNFYGAATFTYVVSDGKGGTSTATVTVNVASVNDVPVAHNNTYIAIEDTLLTGKNVITDSDITAGADTDVETASSSLSISKINGVLFDANGTDPDHLGSNGWMQVTLAHGTLFIQQDGTTEYKPGANSTASDTFTYVLTDGADESAAASVTLNVVAVADLSAANDTASTTEGTPFIDSLATNDSTTSGGTLSFSKASNPSHGSVTVNSNGSYVYTPNANYLGTDSFTYTVSDPSSGESLTRSVTITVNSLASFLSAANDTETTNEDTPITASVAGNDSTTSGAPLLFSKASDPSYGSVMFGNNGTYTYTPTPDFNGTDSFTYTVYDLGSDESQTMTVTITVNAANDAATIGGDDAGAVTEDAANPNLTDTGALTVSDVDTGESVFDSNSAVFDAAHSTRSALGSLTLDSTGSWTYTIANADVQYLAAGQTETLKYLVASADGTSHTVTIVITGTNDAATISGDDAGAVTEDAASPTLTDTGTLSASDADSGESHFDTGSVVFDAAHSTRSALGSLTLDSTGAWTYTVANADVQYLGAGQTETLKYLVASADGTSHTVTIVITGTNDAATIGSDDTGAVREDAANPNLIDTGALTVSDVDSGESVFDSNSVAFDAAHSTRSALGSLTLDSTGAWTYTVANADVQYLAAGQTETLQYLVASADGTSHTVTIVITGTNDATAISGDDAGAVTEDAATPNLTDTGTLSASDTDSGESHFDTGSVVFDAAHSTRGTLGSLTLDSTGAWTYTVANADVQYLAAGQTETLKYLVASTDGTSHTVTIVITGTNDAAAISGDDAGAVTEDAASPTLTDTGSLSVSDTDAGQATFLTSPTDITASAGALGHLSIDNNGTWTYSVANADVQYLAQGQTRTETFTVKSADGSTHDVVITIHGVNDVASIGPSSDADHDGKPDAAQGSVTEDTSVVGTSLVTSGALNVTDADGNQSKFSTTVTPMTGAWGSLSITDGGAWSYTVDNTRADLQALGAGDTRTETFAVSSLDGSATQTITVVIRGIADPVQVSSPTVNEASPYAVFTITGTPGQTMTLALQANGSATASGIDFGSTNSGNLEVLINGTWTPYSANVVIPSGGAVLVRTPVVEDGIQDNGETFTLAATPVGGTMVIGTATIRDDGTGDIYDGNGQVNLSAVRTDDRPITVSNTTVNEASPYAVFVVNGSAGQHVALTLTADSAGGMGEDFGSPNAGNLQVSVDGGMTWANYSSDIILPANGKVLVRTPVIEDFVQDNGETFHLTATPRGGVATAGIATINDQGGGTIFNADGTENVFAVRSNDQPPPLASAPAFPAPAPTPTPTVSPVQLDPVSPVQAQVTSAAGSYDPSAHVLAAVAEARAATTGEGGGRDGLGATSSLGTPLGMDPSLHVLPAVANVRVDVRAVERVVEALEGALKTDTSASLDGEALATPDRVPVSAINSATNSDANALPAARSEAPPAATPTTDGQGTDQERAIAPTDDTTPADAPSGDGAESRPTARKSFTDQLRQAAENRSVRTNPQLLRNLASTPAKAASPRS